MRLQRLTGNKALWLSAALATLFWAYYFFQRKVVGPLNGDEVYFAHVFWLLKEGQVQYVDFFSTHLPLYFRMFAWSFGADELGFLWTIRLSSTLLVAGYLAALWFVLRAQPRGNTGLALLVLSPLLLAFLSLGRMIEVRPDTFGLFLFNVAWAILLTGVTRPKILVAAGVAAASALFSARAPIMLVGLGALCLYLVLARRDYRTLLYLVLMAAAAAGAGLVYYLSNPQYTVLVLRSVFIDPTVIMDRITLWYRIFVLDRAILAAFSAAAFVMGVLLFRRGERDRGAILIAACGCQLLLILLDPAPHLYVYGWSAIPAVIGVGAIGVAAAAYAGLFTAAVFVLLAGAYVATKGHQPPTGSSIRLTVDPVMSHQEIGAMSTTRLIDLMITEDGQQNLESQLRLRREVCRRIEGKILSNFAAHPICLPDSSYYWNELQWPLFVRGDTPRRARVPMAEAEFVRILTEAPPALFVWGKKFYPGRRLLPSLEAKLTCCYTFHDGYAFPAARPQPRLPQPAEVAAPRTAPAAAPLRQPAT